MTALNRTENTRPSVNSQAGGLNKVPRFDKCHHPSFDISTKATRATACR